MKQSLWYESQNYLSLSSKKKKTIYSIEFMHYFIYYDDYKHSNETKRTQNILAIWEAKKEEEEEEARK